MKKLLTTFAFFAMTTATMAADLTFKNVPLPPVREAVVTPFFVGINAGGLYDSEEYTLGATAGVNLTEYISAEIAYDHLHDTDANQLFGNVTVEANVGDLTPYVLGGIGYRWAEDDEAVWNLGGGAKVALTENVDFDVRYRHVVGFETENTDDVITGGLIFKF